jgi:dTDP-glucose 4,6-dehydratase
MGHFIPMMIRKVLSTEKELIVFGSGNQKRSFIYVDDVVSALLLLLEKGKSGEVYNIDGQEEKSVREVVEMIIRQLKKKNLLVKYDKTLPEGSQRRMLDNSKLKKLGWKPQTHFSIGLKRTVADIQSRLEGTSKK